MSDDPKPSKPCPFCGSEDVAALDLTVELQMGSPTDAFAIACARCQAQGPQRDTLKQAIVGWNFRGILVKKRTA